MQMNNCCLDRAKLWERLKRANNQISNGILRIRSGSTIFSRHRCIWLRGVLFLYLMSDLYVSYVTYTHGISLLMTIWFTSKPASLVSFAHALFRGQCPTFIIDYIRKKRAAILAKTVLKRLVSIKSLIGKSKHMLSSTLGDCHSRQ